MKTLKYILIGIVLQLSGTLSAQISVNVNLGSPPMWGPAGYSEVQYYYLPDIQCYYDVRSSYFIYNNGVSWVRRANLPVQYRNYDLYNGYKVVMTDYRGNKPYVNYKEYRAKYPKGYHGQAQKNIGERSGKENNREKAQHNSYSNQKVSRENGKNSGHGKGNGKKK